MRLIMLHPYKKGFSMIFPAGGWPIQGGHPHKDLYKEKQEQPDAMRIVLPCIVKTEPHDGGKTPGKSGAGNG